MANPTRKTASAFTLVELLVVIGIIALLISILLPSLQGARRSAQRTVCMSKLHSMMLAAQLFRQEHADYYPPAGVLPGYDPNSLDDAYSKKYVYYSAGLSNGNANLVCPITTALETEMLGAGALHSQNGVMGALTYDQDVASFLDPQGPNAKFFLCPSQATVPLDILPKYEYMWVTPGASYICQPQSYIYNEYVLGFTSGTDSTGATYSYLKGKGSQIHQPSMTMFAADGVGGSTSANRPLLGSASPLPIYTVYVNTASPMSLGNAFASPLFGTPQAGDKANFDLKRHAGKMNIAFCDSHVETRTISAKDLASVWISAP